MLCQWVMEGICLRIFMWWKSDMWWRHNTVVIMTGWIMCSICKYCGLHLIQALYWHNNCSLCVRFKSKVKGHENFHQLFIGKLDAILHCQRCLNKIDNQREDDINKSFKFCVSWRFVLVSSMMRVFVTSRLAKNDEKPNEKSGLMNLLNLEQVKLFWDDQPFMCWSPLCQGVI